MVKQILFGEIENIEEGQWFESRKSMMYNSFHRKWASGIDGNGKEGASAVVLSGGYEDDNDFGNIIVYTGAGGNDPKSGKQIEDQTWDNSGNAGLLKSMNEGLPVRVIRGASHKSEFSPKSGYTYAGLYSVVDAWVEVGKSGYNICRFRLEYSGEKSLVTNLLPVQLNNRKREKVKKSWTILRYIRDTKISNDIKKLYNHECQVCGFTIKTISGNYAEGAHIRPISTPHEGDDSVDNLLCLCPNHHTMFDRGVFAIKDDLSLIGEISGVLHVKDEHILNKQNLEYHRKSHGYL